MFVKYNYPCMSSALLSTEFAVSVFLDPPHSISLLVLAGRFQWDFVFTAFLLLLRHVTTDATV